MQFEQPAQEARLLDYLHEVKHAATRLERLERAIDDPMMGAPARTRAVIDAVQALRTRQATLNPEVTAIAWQAQHRVHSRYHRLIGRQTCRQKMVRAVGRVGVMVERQPGQAQPVAVALQRSVTAIIRSWCRSPATAGQVAAWSGPVAVYCIVVVTTDWSRDAHAGPIHRADAARPV